MASINSLTRPCLARLILFLFLISHLNSGYRVYAANSNNLILHWNDPSQSSEVEAGSLSFTHLPSSVSFRSTAGNIKLHDVPRVITLALGFSSLQDVEWKGLFVGNIFQRPKANILFIIEGLEKGTLLPFSGKTESYPIVKKEAESYLDIVRISPIRSFISHIRHILPEKPLVISFSAEKQFPQAVSASGVNSHTVTWDSKEQSFKDSELSLDMAMSKTELLKNFEKSGFGEDVKYRKDDREFVVSVPGLKDILFDMNQVEDFLFFAELEMIVHLHDKVKTLDDLRHDDYPHFFTFGISSLKGLVHRYGNNSNQVVAALHVLNNFIPRISSLFSQLYGGQALIEVVNLQRNKIALHEKFPTETNDIYEYLQGHLSSPSLEKFKDNLPAVNLRDSLEEHAMDHLCNSVRSKLFAMQSKLQVICGDVNDGKHSRTRRDTSRQDFAEEKKNCTLNVLNLAALDDYYDGEFPAIFNISLWLMITIALGLYVVCLVLWYMDPGRDSIIYRVTSQRMKTE